MNAIMKNFKVVWLVFLIISCKEDVEPKINSIAEDLKQVINSENVDALGTCCPGCICEQTIGYGADYSFSGDNLVRIGPTTYNLNRMIYFEINTFEVAPKKEKRLVLYFPNQ